YRREAQARQRAASRAEPDGGPDAKRSEGVCIIGLLSLLLSLRWRFRFGPVRSSAPDSVGQAAASKAVKIETFWLAEPGHSFRTTCLSILTTCPAFGLATSTVSM